MRSRLSSWIACAVLLGGCGRSSVWPWVGLDGGDAGEDGRDDVDDLGQTVTSAADSSGSSTGAPNCIDNPAVCTVELTLRRAVDILFVVDNSGSMGGEQGTLAQSFRSFVEVLEEQEVGANYRIGITTTAGDGLLRATSCRTRIDEFTFSWIHGDIDSRQEGCLDHCVHESIAIAEPWVEKTDGQTNLPAGIDMASALQCIGPQGINGPGYERPLEAMYRALMDDSSGFMRDDALLAVIFVTDEADCSSSDDNQVWMQSEGYVFWTTPERPTSAACWNAGVQCFGSPPVFDGCVAQDKDKSGFATSNPDLAVLYPLQRYIDVLTAIAEQKQSSGGQGEVLVALLAGVPIDYPQTGELVYEMSTFDDFNSEYGIGPACNQGAETIHDPPGIPPVRLRQFAEAFQVGERNIYSICDADYGVALTTIADALGGMSERACVSGCVVDADPTTADLQPDCTLLQAYADDDRPDEWVQPCATNEQGWDFPSPDIDVCARALTDPAASTLSKADDMSAQCVTLGSNLEYAIERRKNVPVPAGTSIHVKCQLAAPVGTTCDELD